MMINIDIVNRSSNLPDSEVAIAVAALEVQVNRDFKRFWGIGAGVHHVPQGTPANQHHWWLVLLDNADMAGALGYHDLTATGQPMGKVFVETTKSDGGNWTVTTSHELLEILADPEINLIAACAGKMVAYEVCDAVERDELGYDIAVATASVRVSDFVTPQFFSNTFPPDPMFDAMKHITRPLQILPGGYLSFLEADGWHQVTMRDSSNSVASLVRARPRVGSRRERRRTQRDQWVASTAD